MHRLTSHLTYANVVSTICLFLLLGGAAWAATTLPKDSVGTPQLKNGAVTGAKVKNGSLTGADIKASTLGQVPSAATAGTASSASHATSADTATRAASAGSADHATSADTATSAGDTKTLDGLGPGAFYAAGGIQRIDASFVSEGPEQTLYAANGLTLVAACGEPAIPTLVSINVGAFSSVSGARIDTALVEREGSTEKSIAAEHGLSPTEISVWSTHGAKGGNAGQSVGTLLYTDANRSITFTLESRVSSSGTCQISGTAAVSG